MRNDGDDAALARRPSIGLAGIALVCDGGTRLDIGSEPDENGEVRGIALLAPGQVVGDRVAVEVGFQVDLGGEAAA